MNFYLKILLIKPPKEHFKNSHECFYHQNNALKADTFSPQTEQQYVVAVGFTDQMRGKKLRKTTLKDIQQSKVDLTVLRDDIIPSYSCGGDTKMPKDTKLSVLLFISNLD